MKNSSKEIEWVLNKATPTITLSKDSITLNSSNLSDTFTVTSSGGGEITIVSSDNSVATVSMNENVVTVVGKANGTVTITVNVAADDNYNATSTQISVSVQLVSSTLNDNSWEAISQVAQAGTAANYWNIGDVKMIELNGKIGDYFTADHLELGVFILDFNHKMNGMDENNIIFGCFKSTLTSGVDVALCDSRYGSSYKDGGKCFNMSHKTTATSGDGRYGYNYGGWKGSDLRYDILGATSTPPSQYNTDKNTSNVGYDATISTLFSPKVDTFLAALPSDLRSKLRLWTRWVDAVGNQSKMDSAIKATVDAVTLLARCEVSTSTSWSNSNESNHNTRMAYYTAGNSIIRKNVSNNTAAVSFWECSPCSDDSSNFCHRYMDGSTYTAGASQSSGLAPAFKI